MPKKRKKILIIEDDRAILTALKFKLDCDGLKVFTAEDGKKGLEIALKEHPDLILLDIVMPVMDGLTMMKKLRKDKWGKNVDVVILTNLSTIESGATEGEGKAIPFRIKDYLIKCNWKIADLIDKIKKYN